MVEETYTKIKDLPEALEVSPTDTFVLETETTGTKKILASQFKGDKGDNATITVGNVTTVENIQGASITNSGTTTNAILDFAIPAGPQGPQGLTGETGPANTLTIGSVTGGVSASATITGEAPNQTLNLVLPKGDKGDTGLTGEAGPTGNTGPAGPANTLTIGTVTTGEKSSANISGNAPNQILNLVLEKGPKGDTGPAGTPDYSTVINKPTINGIEINGTQTSADLLLQDKLTAGRNISITEDHTINIENDKLNVLSDFSLIEANKVYTATIGGAVTITYPQVTDELHSNYIIIHANVTEGGSINFGTDCYFYNKKAPKIAVGTYDIILNYNPIVKKWCVSCLEIGKGE